MSPNARHARNNDRGDPSTLARPWLEKVSDLTQKTTPAHGTVASPDDIRRIIANLDDEKLLDITALQPTIRDVEEASLWLAGDSDVFGAGKPLGSIAGEIVAILTADEEEEPRPLS